MGPENRRSNYLICIFLVLITLAAYWKVVGFEAIYHDDPLYVTDNRMVQAGITPETVQWAFTSTDQSNWHPLTWISLMVDTNISRAIAAMLDTGNTASDPRVNHATNLLLHILNTILLFIILNRMTKLRWQSAFVAALFAVHPLHVESVAWISERKDVLSTLFWMLTIWAYIVYTEKPEPRRYLLVAWAFGLGLLSKPMLVSLPLVLLLLDYWPLNRVITATSWKTLIREKAPLLALSVASCAVTFWAQRSGGSVGDLGGYPAGERIANASVSYIGYLIKMLWPQNLSVFYPHPHSSLPIWQTLLSAVAFLTLTALAIKAARRYPYVTVGWFWYVISLVPVIGLVQVGIQAMADRYTYVPLIGIFIAITWGVSETLGRKLSSAPVPSIGWNRAIRLAAAVIIVALIICSYVQVGYWRSGLALFEHEVAINPSSAFAQANLALSFEKQGRADEAIRYYKRAVRIEPRYELAHRNMALLFVKQGKINEAEKQLREAIRIDPTSSEAQHYLGIALAAQGKIDEAIAHLSEACRLNPADSECREHLLRAQAEKNSLKEESPNRK